MKFSEAHMERLARDWSKIAGDDVSIDQVNGVLYAYGSELACLRLFHAFHHAAPQSPRFAYSANLVSWYFSLEILS